MYSDDFRGCAGCGINFRVSDLLYNRCQKCQPKITCQDCLDGKDVARIGDNYYCRDRAACSERIWRCEAKAEAAKYEAEVMKTRRPPKRKRARHHNEDCDYKNGRWTCPEPCLAK